MKRFGRKGVWGLGVPMPRVYKYTRTVPNLELLISDENEWFCDVPTVRYQIDNETIISYDTS